MEDVNKKKIVEKSKEQEKSLLRNDNVLAIDAHWLSISGPYHALSGFIK